MADNILKARVRHAYKTDAEWANANPILLKGEIAYSSDIRQTKTGDGTAHWADLEYDVAKPAWHEHDLSEMINKLNANGSIPKDNDYYISQYVGGGTTTTTYQRRPMSALWEYIKSKANSVYTKIEDFNLLQNTVTDNTKVINRVKNGINSIINSDDSISVNPSINGMGYAIHRGGSGCVKFDGFELPIYQDSIEYLFDGKSSTYLRFESIQDYCDIKQIAWNSTKQYKKGDFVVLLNNGNINSYLLFKALSDNTGKNPLENPSIWYDNYRDSTNTYAGTAILRKILIQVEVVLPKTADWETGYSIYFRAAGQTVRDLLVEAGDINKENWQTEGRISGVCGPVVTIFPNKNMSGKKRSIRLSFYNSSDNTSWTAITQIAITGLVGGLEGTVLNKGGGELYGTVTPYQNNSVNLGSSSKKWNSVYANTFQGNLNGSANSAIKLASARNISANDDYIMNFNFDGSGNVSTQLRAYNAIIAVANANNYPYHRFAKLDTLTDSYQDRVTNLLITQDFNGGGWGICRIVLRTYNQSNTLSLASVDWLVRYGLAADSVQIGLYTKDGSTYADAFIKTADTYYSTVVRNLGSGSRGNIGRTWTFINSSEAANTTTTDKKTSYEVYTSVADAGTKLHNQAYTSTITGYDVGTVKYANTSGSATSATSAEKATQDSAGQQINTTYIKGLSASGKTITYTKGDNKTGTATISGFVPMEGTTKDNPMTGAIIQSSTDNGHTYLAGYTPSGSRLISSSSSGTRTTELTPSSFTTNLETGDAETSGALDVTFYPQKNKQMIYLGGSSSDWIIRGVGTPVQDGDAVNKNYIDSTLENWSNDLVEELQGLIPVYGTWEDTPVTGNIVFNGKATVTGVKEPSSDSDVATKGYVDRQNSIKSVTLTAAGWTGTTAPYTQAVKVDGITEDDNPVMVSMLAAGATPDTQKAYNKAFGIICSGTGTTANDRVRFSVYSKPAIDITVGLKGV